jgi:molybdopterin-guanine dinucleotide biosynthesis protein A
MGGDKGALTFGGQTLVERAVTQLKAVCDSVFVSVRNEQIHLEPYAALALIEDQHADAGPATGLLSTWSSYPGSAILALAVDMPLVDSKLLSHLIEARDRQRIATAFRHPDGTVEPLCTIYEPAAATELKEIAADAGSVSLRRWLETADIRLLDPPDPRQLVSVNTPAALEAATTALAEP